MLYNIKLKAIKKGGSCYVAIFLLCNKNLCYIAHPNLPDAVSGTAAGGTGAREQNQSRLKMIMICGPGPQDHSSAQGTVLHTCSEPGPGLRV